MKKLFLGAVAAGLIATPALADVTFTQANGVLGPLSNTGQVQGYGWQGAGGGPAAPLNPYNIYDNVPTFAGGGATAGTDGHGKSVA